MQLAASKATARQCAPAQRRAACQTAGPKPVARVVTHAATEESVNSNGAITHTSSAMVDFGELSDIIRMVHDTDIIELELKSKKFTLNLRKKEALAVEQPVVQYMPAPQMAAPAPAPAAAPAAAAPAPAAAAPAPTPKAATPLKIEGIEITSPMAGTFYASAAPGEPPLAKAGDRVKKGQVVGIVEAMKLMNEIEAEISGEVVKVLVENGTPITVGMPLFIIRP